MKPKRLEWLLQELETFSKPKIKLEQYATSPELAVCIVDSIEDIVGGLSSKCLLDLGCGCGVLMTAAAAGCQPALCLGVDIDEEALAICKENLETAEVEHWYVSYLEEKAVSVLPPGDVLYPSKGEHNSPPFSCDLLHANVLALDGVLQPQFDVVVTNPPFGTKNNSGLDMEFIRAGLALLKPGGHIFSLHKTSTRDYILKTAKKWENVEKVECVAQLRWDLPATYKFHKKKSVDIHVDLIHCVRK